MSCSSTSRNFGGPLGGTKNDPRSKLAECRDSTQDQVMVMSRGGVAAC